MTDISCTAQQQALAHWKPDAIKAGACGQAVNYGELLSIGRLRIH